MKKILKISLISFLSLITLLVITGFMIGWFFEEEVKKQFEKELNSNLTTELTIDGPIELSLFKNFPSASLTFHDVTLAGSLPGRGNLLEAGEIAMVFDVWKMVRGEYEVTKIAIKEGKVNIYLDANENANYNIWKSNPSGETASSEVEILLKTVNLEKVHINYLDENFSQHYSGFLHKGTLSGAFSSSQFVMDAELALLAEKVRVKNIDYFPNSEVSTNLSLDIDMENKIYEFRSGGVIINDDHYAINGNVDESGEATALDIAISGDDISLKSLLVILPQNYQEALKDFDSRGTFYFDGTIKGELSRNSDPHIAINFGLEYGSITNKKMKHDLKEVSFSGTFSNGTQNKMLTTYLEIPSFTARLNNNPINFAVKILDFNDPEIDVSLTSDLDMAILGPALKTPDLQGFDGNVIIDKLRINANLSDIQQGRNLSRVAASGSITFNGVSFEYLTKQLKDINGSVHLNINELALDNFSMMVDGNDFQVSGKFDNMLTFLSNVIEGKPKPVLEFALYIESERIDVDELIRHEYAAKEIKTDSIAQDKNYIPSNKFDVFEMFRGKLSTTIQSFNFREFDAENISGSVYFAPDNFQIRSFNAAAVDGQIALSGNLKALDDERLVWRNDVQFTGIDVNKLFIAFENFGQDVLVADHLDGTITTSGTIDLEWDKEFEFQYDKLYVKADVEITDGRLYDFEPLRAMSSFVKVSELENIQFNKLTNEIEIRNEKILIPAMHIQSTAMNMLMAGSHTFENQMDYQFKINLMNVLARKFKWGKVKLSEVDNRPGGLVNLYVVMHGHVNDPQFRMDKQYVKEHIYEENSGYQDRNALDLFEEEFIEEEEESGPMDWEVEEEEMEFLWEEDTTVTSERR